MSGAMYTNLLRYNLIDPNVSAFGVPLMTFRFLRISSLVSYCFGGGMSVFMCLAFLTPLYSDLSEHVDMS